MDGWTIGLVIGGAVIVLLLVLMTVVVRAAARVATQVQEVLVALEDVRAKTDGLATLDRMGDATITDGAVTRPVPDEKAGGEGAR